MFDEGSDRRVYLAGIRQWLAEPGLLKNPQAMKQVREAKNPIEATRISYDHIEDGYDGKEPLSVTMKDFTLEGLGEDIHLRIYLPEHIGDSSDLGGLFYIHGGGYVSGSIQSHDKICAEICQEAQCAVIAINYRLGPEHSFPANLEDCMLCAESIETISSLHGINPKKWVVGGDSAGAALSTALVVALREKKQPVFKGQLLFYGNFDSDYNTPSMINNKNGPVLTRDSIMNVHQALFGVSKALGDERYPEMFVLHNTSMQGLPPAYISACELCQFCSESLRYHERLIRDGVDSVIDVHPGMPHGYIHARHVSPEAMAYFKNSIKHLSRLIDA
ncbi:MAG: hypothetical protein COA43_05900 [Robiginitomaculum sp.]|nr:MAG: hypothetical protein COA43_05900 [Robiginitomaculum sp.]